MPPVRPTRSPELEVLLEGFGSDLPVPGAQTTFGGLGDATPELQQLLQGFQPAPAPTTAPPTPSILGELPRGIEAGLRGFVPLGAGLGSVVLDAFGADEIARDLAEFGQQSEEAILRDLPPTVTFDEVFDSPGNFARFALRNIGEQIPIITSIILTGGAGGLIGRLVGRGALSYGEGVAGLSRFGTVTGAIAGATALETGGTAQELFGATGDVKPTASFLAGIAKGALEAAVPLAIATRFGIKTGVAEGILARASAFLDKAPTRLLRAGAGLSVGLAAEAVTEFLQEAVDVGTRSYVDDNFDATSPETRSRLLESAFVGGLVGAVFGGLGGAIGGRGIGGETELTSLPPSEGGRLGLTPEGDLTPPATPAGPPAGPPVPPPAAPGQVEKEPTPVIPEEVVEPAPPPEVVLPPADDPVAIPSTEISDPRPDVPQDISVVPIAGGLVAVYKGADVGSVSGSIEGNTLTVGRSLLVEEERGKGIGVQLYERLIEEAQGQGLNVQSSPVLTIDSVRVWEALGRRGHNVVENPGARTSPEGNKSVSLGESVFTIEPTTPISQAPARPPVTKEEVEAAAQATTIPSNDPGLFLAVAHSLFPPQQDVSVEEGLERLEVLVERTPDTVQFADFLDTHPDAPLQKKRIAGGLRAMSIEDAGGIGVSAGRIQTIMRLGLILKRSGTVQELLEFKADGSTELFDHTSTLYVNTRGNNYRPAKHKAGTAEIVFTDVAVWKSLSRTAKNNLRKIQAAMNDFMKTFKMKKDKIIITVDGRFDIFSQEFKQMDSGATASAYIYSEDRMRLQIQSSTLERSDTLELADVIAHEGGHILTWSRFAKLDFGTQLKIINGFNNQLKKGTAGNIRDFASSLLSPAMFDYVIAVSKGGAGTEAVLSTDTIGGSPEYWFSFSEYLANQVSRWYNTTEQPLSRLDTFFKGLAEGLKQLYEEVKIFFNIKSEEFKAETDVAAWLDSLAEDWVGRATGLAQVVKQSAAESAEQAVSAVGRAGPGRHSVLDVSLGGTATAAVQVNAPISVLIRLLVSRPIPGGAPNSGILRYIKNPDNGKIYTFDAFDMLHGHASFAIPEAEGQTGVVLPTIGTDAGMIHLGEDGKLVVTDGLGRKKAETHVLPSRELSEGAIGVNIEQMMAKVGISRKERKKARQGVDRINKLLEWGLTLRQMAQINPKIAGLRLYNELMDQWSNASTQWKARADSTIKEWRRLSRESQERLAKFLFEVDAMTYLGKKEKPRQPTLAELEALAKKHKLTNEAFVVYQQVRDDMEAFLAAIEEVLVRDIRDTVSNPIIQEIQISKVTKQFRALKTRPYFPHSRFGDFTVVVKDSKGKTAHMEQFATRQEARGALKKIMLSFRREDGFIARVDKIPAEAKPFRGLPPALLQQLKELPNITQTQRIWIEQLVVELSPAESFRKRLARRKDVPGFSLEAMRSYANYFWHGSNYLARIQFQRPMQEAINQVNAEASSAEFVLSQPGQDVSQRRRIADFMQNHMDQVLNPAPDWAQIRSIAFMWWLGFAPQSAILNLTQIPMVGLPYLSARYGGLKATNALRKAMGSIPRMMKRDTSDVTDDFLVALTRAVENGVVNESYATELAATAEGPNLSGLLPGNKAQRGMMNIAHWSAFMFQTSEKFNRRTVFAAAWELAMADPQNKVLDELQEFNQLEFRDLISKGFGETEARAYLAARDAVWSTQFQYSRHARPRFMRGRKGVVFTFFTFVQQMVFFAAHDRGRTQFLLMMFVLAGMMGLPFAEDINAVARFASRKLLGKDFDIERATREFVVDVMGEDSISPDLILHGISRVGFGIPAAADLLGIPFPQFDMSASVGLGRIIPGLETIGPPSKSFDAAFSRAATTAAGASFGIGINLMKFLSEDELPWGDSKRYERAFPRSIKNGLKGLRFLEEGRERTRTGATVIDFDVSDPGQLAEVVGQFFGFQPTRLSRKWDRQRMEQEAIAFWTIRRGMLLRQIDHARTVGDSKVVEDVLAAIRRYNKDVAFPGFHITGKELRQSQRERMRRRRLFEAGLPASKRQGVLSRDIKRLFPEVEDVEVINPR